MLLQMLAFIAGHIEERPMTKLCTLDLLPFLRLMVVATQHQSLVVSIPVLHSWVRILKSQRTGTLEAVWSVVEPLLDTASQRIIRYELLSEDSGDPSVVFLNEDIDTIPERHAFLGNYRRFCYQIIEIVAQKKPTDAISHLLPQVNNSLDRITAETPALNPATYQKSSSPLLRLDAHLTVVEAALKGYSKWVSGHGKEPQKDEQERNFLESNIENWASGLLTRKYEDPLMKQRIVKLAVECSARALERNQAFALKVLEHLLLTQTVDQPEHLAYSEAVKELQVYATSELRRLAFRHADYFATFYDQLEAKIQEILNSSRLDEKAEAEMYGTLLIVLQRATQVDLDVRRERIKNLTESFLRGWQSDRLERSLSTFEAFCENMAVDRVGPYLASKHAGQVEDWAAIQLDQSGDSIQSSMEEFVSHIPLRITKTALAAMMDKLDPDSQAYQIAVDIWSARIPMLLPKILKLVDHAHRLHDLESWPNISPESRKIIGQVLQDRFWQAGISTGSRDDFYSRVTSTRTTLEGFASFVRGKIRLVRESCYQVLFSMSKLKNHFYSYPELPGPLAVSVIASSRHLSSHQFSVLLQMIRCMVEDCPLAHRSHFLPPTLSSLFQRIDDKVTSEWEMIGRRKVNNTGDDNLTAEMKEESILRQLTYTAVNLVTVLLDPARDQSLQRSSDHYKRDSGHIQGQAQDSKAHPQNQKAPLRDFILSTPAILEPLMVFATHVLTIPDSRSTSTIAKVLRTIVPAFAALSSPDNPTTAAIREYIASSILQAAITSLHDGYFADLQKDLASLIATIWVAFGCVTHFPPVTTPSSPSSEANGATAVTIPAYDRPPLSQTPRNTIASLPGLSADRIDAVVAALTATGGVAGPTRQQRALVLNLLDGLRGVRISELGKLKGSARSGSVDRRAAGSGSGGGRSRVQQRYMGVDTGGVEQGEGQAGGRHGDEGMEGVEGRGGVGILDLVEDGPDLGGVRELLG
jgi:exportin-5